MWSKCKVQHSFKDKAFIDLCRKEDVGIVFAADSEFPLIADITTDFVYARIMGTAAKEKAGYPAAQLKTWAERARDWEKAIRPKPPCWWRRPRPKRNAMSLCS